MTNSLEIPLPFLNEEEVYIKGVHREPRFSFESAFKSNRQANCQALRQAVSSTSQTDEKLSGIDEEA